ncbi:protein FAM8A1 [Lagopus muta]|uniref:protein FAM8A1 n=1 Tax=Lagopus muta TaxID=64668 RepID=UPI0020A1A4F8|nr:protein FAM8A1 [Lagopus muta]
MPEMADPGTEPGTARSGAGAAATAGGAEDRSDGGGEAVPASPPPPSRSAPTAAGSDDGGKALSAAEYARRVHQWLWDSYCGYLSWHCGLPALLAAGPAARLAAPPPPPPPPPSAPPGSAPAAYYSPFYLFAPPPAAAAPGPRAPPSPAPASSWPPAAAGLSPLPRATPGSGGGSAAPREAAGRPAGREFIIPSLAHRFIAEMVDFFILFFIKATIVLSIMHLSGIKDISKFAMHYIIEEIDEDTSMEDLQKMMVVALIYRLLVCFYEIICIWGAGGATPGKFLLGLRVVTCDTSVLIAPSRVLVIPSSNVSMTTSTIRALIKNFSIASFFPAFITLLFFQHNRTAYDIVAGTIVVRRNGIR